jgi:hypothetical protein
MNGIFEGKFLDGINKISRILGRQILTGRTGRGMKEGEGKR